MKILRCSEDDFEQLLTAEQEYLSNLKKPNPVVETKKAYIQALRNLAQHQYVLCGPCAIAVDTFPLRYDWENTRQITINVGRHLALTGDYSNLSQAKQKVEASYGQVQNAEALVTLYEAVLGISERWTGTSAEYIQYYQENIETTYQKAIDELERAVVMRICELTKMKASGTGACDIN